MKLKYLLAASVVSLSAGAIVATPAAAQQITSGIEGSVTDESGMALPGATITITDTRTGQTRTLTADADGSFRAGQLPPGGPYTVTVTAGGYEGQTVEEQFINISGNTEYTFTLAATAAGGADNVIVVTGARAQATQLAVGPGTAFSTETLESFPSITRDVRDIIRIDPRVSLDRNNDVDRISCLGGNDRSNTFTVDGIVQADSFGLNGTPFAARNALPIPFDVIEQTTVEFAPFDVEYSDFTGCAVNVVTKAGGNRFSGSAFFTFRNEDLRGSTVDGQDFTPAPFEEKRWGATLSGPIIPDRLFFSLGYEETDLGDANDFGPAGSGFPNEALFVTQAQFDEFSQIAQDVYGIDVGGYPASLPESSVRYFGRIDAYINEDHRLEATYQRLEETNVESDTGDQELTGLNSFEDEGTVSDYYSIRLYSDWSDKVSTELRLSRSDVTDVQGPVGGGEAQDENPITRLVVGLPATPGQTTQNGVLATGPGIFRSANALEQRVDQARFQMNIDAGDHAIKLGAELNDLSVFNLFAINATGTIYFRSLEDFRNGLVASGDFSTVFGDIADNLIDGDDGDFLGGATIRSTPSGDINEAAATFGRQIYSFYAQDQWQATDQLTVTGGLRFQIYDGSAPRLNPLFQERFGFSNSNPFSRIDPVLLPRLAATYEFDNDGFFFGSSLTGGVGVFSGGDPVVFFSNAFSNDGFASVDGSTFSSDCAALTNADGSFNVLDGAGNFTGFPQCAVQNASGRASAGGGDVQSTDPDFKIPTVLRANLGFSSGFGTETGFFSNWNVKADYIYSRFRNPLNVVDLAQAVDPTKGLNGFTADGRPIYSAIDPLNPLCNASLVPSGGTPPVYQNASSACFRLEDAAGNAILNSRGDEIRPRIDDFIQLTNGRDYESHVFSLAFAKRFGGGVFTEGGSVDVNFGYAFTDSKNFRNVNSSTATSNFDENAYFDIQNPQNTTSNFETRHAFTAAVNFKEEFFDGFDSQLAFFFSAREGRPFSLTFDGGGVFADGSSGNDNALLYIPNGANDPNVSPLSDPAAVQGLLDYLNNGALVNGRNNVFGKCSFTAGQTITRNSCREDWVFDLDMRIAQEIPGPGRLFGLEDKIELFADIDNALNLIDSSWNTFSPIGAFGDGQVIDLVDGGVDPEGRYIISGLNPDDNEGISTSASAWRIQVGVRYEF